MPVWPPTHRDIPTLSLPLRAGIERMGHQVRPPLKLLVIPGFSSLWVLRQFSSLSRSTLNVGRNKCSFWIPQTWTCLMLMPGKEADKVWLLGLWFSSSAAKEGGTRYARGAEYHPLHDTRRADILSLCVKP